MARSEALFAQCVRMPSQSKTGNVDEPLFSELGLSVTTKFVMLGDMGADRSLYKITN